MSKESALKFLNTLSKNERAQELLKTKKKPESLEEQAKIYSEIAAELGEQIAPEDFIQMTKELEERIKQKTEAAASDLEALEDEDVENVAGGYYYQTTAKGSLKIIRVYDECSKDFTDTNCWWDDACDYYYVAYFQCGNHYTYDYG